MKTKITFIIINILSSFILFARSILFLKYLPAADLGFIMLFQAVIAMMDLAQIGLLNGGFRIFAVDSNVNHFKAANNSNVTYIILITGILLLFSFFSTSILHIRLEIFILAIFAGGFYLLRNWFTNILIARQKLRQVNILNLITAFASAFLAILIFEYGLIGAVISISSTYIVFVAAFLVLHKEYIPNKLKIDKSTFKLMLYYGFIPYLSGIAVLINNQIDRFFIAGVISLEALGQFYLAVTFMTVFNMLPTNLNSLFGPQAINSYSNMKWKNTFRTTKIFFWLISGYTILSALVLLFFGEIVVRYIFPDKVEQLKYLFIMLPGIMALTLAQPFSFILYVALNLKAILWSNILSLLFYLGLLTILLFYQKFNIENVAIGKSLQGVSVLFFLVFATALNWGKIISFHFISTKENN